MRGIGKGALFGFAAGFVYGFIRGNNTPCEDGGICVRFTPLQSGLMYSLFTTPLGAITGGFVGSLKSKITIGGSRDKYIQQRMELEQYWLGH